MSKVLYIKANSKLEGQSRTFKISDEFIDVYKNEHPDDEIITLDLYDEGVRFLTSDDIEIVFGPKNEESRNHPILKYAYQFQEAAKYVISAPMWNLSIPAILKAYIDYITVTGITFKYTAEGPVGLCHGKKGIHIMSTGGEYTSGPAQDFEMANRYLKAIFAFFGVTDFTSIFAEKLDVIGEDVDGIINGAIKEAKDAATNF